MDEFCRLCASKNELINIFSTRIGNNMRNLIKVASGIEILKTDEVSQKVCLQCCTLCAKIYQFRQRSLKNNQEIMDAHNKRKLIELSRIATHKKDTFDKKTTTNNKINKNCGAENKKKSIKYHPSIIQMKKQYPNLKFPSMQPDSHFQPFITLLTNEVSDWYQNKTSTENAILQIGKKSVKQRKTFTSVAGSSSENTDVDVIQVDNNSSKEKEEIQNNDIESQNNDAMEYETVEKRASIGQIQNKQEDMKRKKSNESNKNEEVAAPHKKIKSITQLTEGKDCNEKINSSNNKDIQNKIDSTEKDDVEKLKSSPQVLNKNEALKNVTEDLTVEKQRNNKVHKINNEAMETKKKEENRLQLTAKQNTNKEVQKKSTELIQKKKEKEISAQIDQTIKELEIIAKDNHNRTTQKVANKNVEVQKIELRPASPKKRSAEMTQTSSPKKTRMSKEVCESSSTNSHIDQKSEEILRKQCETSPVRVVLQKFTCEKNNIGNNNLTQSLPEPCTTTINSVSFSKDESNVSFSKSKSSEERDRQMESGKIKTKTSVVEISPSKEKYNENLNTSMKQNLTAPVESKEASKEPVLIFSTLKELLKGKLNVGSKPEDVQEVAKVPESPNNKANNSEITNVNAVPSSFANDDSNSSNNQKIDFVTSLNLIPCSEGADYPTYTKNEMMRVRFVKFCCKYCNASHNTLKSLKQHVKKYHTSCALCNDQLESIEDRKKHMLFYCPKRTIKIPQVKLTKVDKQKEIVSKYEKAFLFLKSPNKESTFTSNISEETEIQTDKFGNFQDLETTNDNDYVVNFECDSSDHEPLFDVADYNDVLSTMNSENEGTIKEIYDKIKDRTLYKLDTVIDNSTHREYYLKGLTSEVDFQNIKVDVKYGERMRFQYDKSENLPNPTIYKNFWDNETVTSPPIRRSNSQPKTSINSNNVESTDTSNKHKTNNTRKEATKDGGDEVSLKLYMERKIMENMTSKTPVQNPNISGGLPKTSNTEIEKLKPGNKIASQQPSVRQNVTENIKNKTAVQTGYSPLAGGDVDRKKVQNMVNGTVVQTGSPPQTCSNADKKKVPNMVNATAAQTAYSPLPGINIDRKKVQAGSSPQTCSIADNKKVPNMVNTTAVQTGSSPLTGSNADKKKAQNMVNATVVQNGSSSLTDSIVGKKRVRNMVNTAAVQPGSSPLTGSNADKKKVQNMVNGTVVQTGSSPQTCSNADKKNVSNMVNATAVETGSSTLTSGNADKKKVQNMVNGTVVQTWSSLLTCSNADIKKVSNMVNATVVQNGSSPLTGSNADKKKAQNMVNATVVQNGSSPLTGSNADKKKTQNMVNATVVQNGSSTLTSGNADKKKAQNMVNATAVQTGSSTLTSGNADKKKVPNMVNTTAVQTGYSPLTGGKVDKKKVQNMTNGTAVGQPYIAKQATPNLASRVPLQRPNMDKTLTKYTENINSIQTTNQSSTNKTTKQKSTHVTNLPVTSSQVSVKPTQQPNPMLYSRPRPPKPPVSSNTQQPTLLNTTNNISSPLTTQFFPLFLHGQNLIFIQQKPQPTIPVSSQLQTTTSHRNSNAIEVNRQPSLILNPSFPMPNATVLPIPPQLPSTLLTNNNVNSQTSSRIRVKDVRELL